MFKFLDILAVGLSILLFYLVGLYIDFRRKVRLYQNFPGLRTIFSNASIAGNTLPPTKGVALGRNRAFVLKYEDFQRFGQDAFINISATGPVATYFLADASAIKEVAGSRARFPKPVEQYGVLSFFGRNIVASEFHEWKRFRKTVAPSFNEKNNNLVWDETIRNTTSLFDNVWGKQTEISYDHVLDLTMPLALFIIASAGFGRQISWDDDEKLPPGHIMSFKTAIHNVSSDVFKKIIVPDWLVEWGPTKGLRRVRDSFAELRLYMSEMVRDRKLAESKREHVDLFSTLLAASELEDEEFKLSDDELIGNIFMFLIAGHETTAHTLSFAMAMLALYPDEQEILFQHIKTVIPDGRLPTYDDMPRLTQSMAVFYETLRMFPSVVGIPKYSAEDTTLTVLNDSDEKVVLPVPQGTGIILHVPGLHYNPRYWEDPHSFKPSRFRKDYPKDAFIPFSAGARACVGRGFFETSGTAFLTTVVQRYKIEVKEDPQFVGETFEERRARVTMAKPGLTLTPVRTPLVFKRR